MCLARSFALPLTLISFAALGATFSCTTSEPYEPPTSGSSSGGANGSGSGGMTMTTGTGGSTGTGGTATTGSGGAMGTGGTTMGGTGGAPMDAGGTGGTKMDAGGADMGGGAMLSFATDVKPILTKNCTSCHGTDGGLSVGSLATVMAATSAATANCAKNVSKMRIVAGDPTMSFLYIKISTPTAMLGTGCGNQMPRSGPPYLSTADQTTIKNWITQGANP